jgi:hypothetical protein
VVFDDHDTASHWLPQLPLSSAGYDSCSLADGRDTLPPVGDRDPFSLTASPGSRPPPRHGLRIRSSQRRSRPLLPSGGHDSCHLSPPTRSLGGATLSCSSLSLELRPVAPFGAFVPHHRRRLHSLQRPAVRL